MPASPQSNSYTSLTGDHDVTDRHALELGGSGLYNHHVFLGVAVGNYGHLHFEAAAGC